MDRRALLAGSAAGLWGASARAQQACFDRMDCFDTQRPGPSLDLQFTSGTLDPRITFTRASVASYFDVAGTMQSAASGAPRFDFDPVTHLARGLLIEESRTNLLLNSATLGTQSVTVTAAATTLSFYGTGTVTLSGTFAGSLVGSGVFPTRSTLTFTPTAGSLTCTVTGSVLNAQVETGAFATSWISTAGATATRAAEAATMPVGSWFNASAGTLAVDFDTARPTGTAGTAAGFSDGTFGNSFYFTNQTIQATGSGSSPAAQGGSLNASGSVNKMAASYAPAQLAESNNGAPPQVSAGLGIAPFPWTLRLTIGCTPWAFDSQLNGHIRRVRSWPRALGAGELQGVTR